MVPTRTRCSIPQKVFPLARALVPHRTLSHLLACCWLVRCAEKMKEHLLTDPGYLDGNTRMDAVSCISDLRKAYKAKIEYGRYPLKSNLDHFNYQYHWVYCVDCHLRRSLTMWVDTWAHGDDLGFFEYDLNKAVDNLKDELRSWGVDIVNLRRNKFFRYIPGTPSNLDDAPTPEERDLLLDETFALAQVRPPGYEPARPSPITSSHVLPSLTQVYYHLNKLHIDLTSKLLSLTRVANLNEQRALARGKGMPTVRYSMAIPYDNGAGTSSAPLGASSHGPARLSRSSGKAPLRTHPTPVTRSHSAIAKKKGKMVD